MNVTVLVPRRADGGHRDRLWAFAKDWWERDHPDWPVIEGHHLDGPFNRSKAVNEAARQAGDWDVAVVIDADVIANADAVRTAADIAHGTGRMVVSHDDRVMLNRQGTDKILDGYRGPWRVRQMVERVYTDSVSCAVAIPRALFDEIGGFPEQFVGWGFEDSAFHLAAETLTGKPIIRLSSELYHLHHPLSPEAAKTSPTYAANRALLDRYKDAAGNPDAMRALLADVALDLPDTRIPRILHRTVPADTSPEVEGWWRQFQSLHPGWDCRTHRDPLDPKDWPLTGDLWKRCSSGAQKAGLIRLEALFTHGGVYVDSDIEPFRSFEPLLNCEAFAGWEDETTVPDFLLACRPGHPAFGLMIEKARSVIEGGGDAYQSGPAVSTEVLPNRPDVLLLPPGAFAPYHYLEKSKRSTTTAESHPWAWCAHHWHHSWGTPTAKASIEKRQR